MIITPDINKNANYTIFSPDMPLVYMNISSVDMLDCESASETGKPPHGGSGEWLEYCRREPSFG